MTVVLDSWAVLALLDGEPAADAVDEVLAGDDDVVMSWINLGEVFYVVSRRHGDDEARAAVRDLRLHLRPLLPSASLVLDAAAIKAAHRMPYADAYAAATAVAEDAELLTGDPELLVDGAPWRWRDLR